MVELIKKIIKQTISFTRDQYLIIFFVVALGFKLFFLNTYVLKVTWPENQYWYGILFGFLSAGLLFLPLIFIKKYKNTIAIILALLLSLLIFVDNVYFSYFSSLPTAGLLSSASQASDVGPAIKDLIKVWMLLYFVDVIIAVLTLKPARLLAQKMSERFVLPKLNWRAPLVVATIIVACFCSAIFSLGLSKLTEVMNRGYDTVSTAQYYGAIMAHVIDVTRFVKEEMVHLSPDQEKVLIDWVKKNKPVQATSRLNGVAKNKNIIMIQVESLGGFVLNQKVNGKELTPNLDKLASLSQYFPNERFMIGAGHTSDADFTANTSYYPLYDASTFVLYGNDDFVSLPKILISNGYSAYAYHGYNRNFWNRDTTYGSLGYQKFYAADNYSKGAKINLGLNDGDFLSETADYIKKQPKPSFSYAITLSSHVPFEITSETKGLGVNAKDYPDQVGGYLENINYTDRMLGRFFDKLKAAGLYDDSLIVVYGDHEPVLPAFTAGTIKYNPSTDQGKEVPLIFKLPNETEGAVHKNQGSHLDIMPTILDLVGVKTDTLMFGQSLFASGDKILEVCTDQLFAFPISGDCKADLKTTKNKAAEIIRYNQFDNLKR